MSDMPQTTLTQRRNQISGGAKKLTKSGFSGGAQDSSMPIGGKSQTGATVDKSAVIKVVIWIVVVVFIGVGAALFVTNMLSSQPRQQTTPPPASAPVAQLPDPEPEFNNEPVDGGTGSEIDPEVLPSDIDGDLVEQPDDQATPPQAPVTAGSVTAQQLEQYSDQPRALAATTSGNTLTLSKFRFFDSAIGFNYIFTETKSTTSTIDPDIKVSYEGNDLVVEFNNVRADNVTGNGGSTRRNFTNVSGISGTETTNRNGVSRYVFKMNSKFEHRIIIDQETAEIKLQIKNRG